MDRLKYLLLLTLFLSYNQSTIAQNKNSIQQLNAIDRAINESIFISTNTNTFLTGETLYYKLFCIDQTTNIASKHSQIAYVELIDNNKKSIFNHKLFLKNATENGDFFLPTTLETGNYKLIGFTSWMLNKSIPEYFNIEICIINPYQISPRNGNDAVTKNNTLIEEQETSKETTLSSNKINLPFSIEFNKKTYLNRERVDLKVISASEEFLKGSYSISVRKKEDLSFNNKLSFEEHRASYKNKDFNNNINDEDLIIPELRGEIITGKIISKIKTDNLENKTIAFSIPGKNFEFKITKTDVNGRFIFNLENKNSSANIIIQIIDPDKENFNIEINNPKILNYSTLSFDDLQLNTEFKKSIEERAIASQIENAYYNTKKDSLVPTKNLKTFFDPLSEEYILDNYTRFPTLKETVVEIIKGMYYSKTNNNYTLHLKDYDDSIELSLPALVLVDGLIIEDINELFEYNTKNIYKVNIVRGGYYVGTKIFNGLISFTTKNNDYSSNLNGSSLIKPIIKRPLSRKEYFQPDYSANNKNTRIPDYRYQLLWMPETHFADKENIISFFTSDISGTFEITIEGFSENGTPIFEKKIFAVK